MKRVVAQQGARQRQPQQSRAQPATPARMVMAKPPLGGAFQVCNNIGAGPRLLAVDVGAIAQLFTGFKMRNIFAFQLHFITGFRIAADARGTVVERKTAETADFDALAAGERRRHMLQHLFHCILNHFCLDMSVLAS